MVAAVLCSCIGGGNSGSGSGGSGSGKAGADTDGGTEAPSQTRAFPQLTIPSVYGEDTEEAKDYVLEHYWDGFFKGEYATTPASILGVTDAEVEQSLANYIQILQMMKESATPDSPGNFNKARKSVGRLFSQMEACQLADTSAKTYLRFTEMVSKYLFDPNSPMRDEDLDLPFVEGLAKSPCTRENMRNAYRYEASQCRKCGFGQTAADFSYKTASGNKGSLHAIRADYTMLFFSNPGCDSCKEIIDDIKTCGFIRPMISEKRLAIVNIYIDEEVQKWRDYLPHYPSDWINGYDYTFSLRDHGGYDIRAIPSLYLLDANKRVLMKDAPTQRVLAYLEKIYNQ